MVNKIVCCISILCLLLATKSYAEQDVFTITIKDHVFSPSKVIIPAHKKVKLVILNQDKLPEEFDSFDLNREKVLFPGRKSTIYIGPLPPGSYQFFGEYHPLSAQGVVEVREKIDAN